MRSKTKTISFVTTAKVETALRKAAADQDRSMSWIISKALEQFLGLTKPH